MENHDASHAESLSAEVGRRLRERRHDQERTMTDVASEAGVSTAHLGEIETGKSFCSLPVLLRLSRALDYPMTEILPRLGGHRVRSDAVSLTDEGLRTLSHPELDLTVSELGVSAGTEYELALDGHDAHIRVMEGSCEIGVADQSALVNKDDVVDLAYAKTASVRAVTDSALLVILGANDRKS